MEKKATNLKELTEKHYDEMIKYLIELYEFQENIKITYSIDKK